MEKVKTYNYYDKIFKVISSILLIFIPIMLILCFINFKLPMLIIVILISLFLIYFWYCCKTYRIEIYQKYVIHYGLEKKVFEISTIETIELDSIGNIKIVSNGKTYKIRGIISLIDQMPNDEKNQEIINSILEKIEQNKIFVDTDFLINDEIKLVVDSLFLGDIKKGYVPAYFFNICLLDGTRIGKCDLRLGHNDNLYYGGNIGYIINEEYRGNHFAGKACILLFELAKKHNLDFVIITCNPDNFASRKTCEYAGCKFIEEVELPLDNDMRLKGETKKCIYRYFL